MADNNYLKRVAIVGAGGNSGIHIAEALIKAGNHTVTAISRTGSTSKLPEGINVKYIDYDNPSTIVAALRGEDVLIITLSSTSPKDTEAKLVRAAAEAKVGWVIPNDWSPDMANEALSKGMIIGEAKKQTRNLLTELKTNFISVSTGFWYEWSLAIAVAYGFDFAKREVTFFDEGETKITTSTWPQVGRAVAGLLSLPLRADGAPHLEQFKNSFIYVSSFVVSQKDMLESVLRVTKTNIDDWKINKEPAQERYAAGLERMKGGDREGFGIALYTRDFFPDGSGNVGRVRGFSNDILGLPQEDIDEATKRAVQRAEEKNGTWFASMKILTPQEEADHNKAVWEGGLLGGAGGLAFGVGAVWYASKRSHGFRSLSLPFRAFLVTSSATFLAVTSADRASRHFERTRHPDSDYKNKTEREEAEINRDVPLLHRAKTFVSEQRYPIVFGSWVASMGIAMGLVSRNRWLTGQQKLVQARVYAQGLTLAVLVASFALEGNDLRAGKGRWETIKVLDPSGSGKMVEKRIHHEAYSGEDQWMDMIESQEEKMKRRGHSISAKEEKARVEAAAKQRKEPVKKSQGVKKVEAEMQKADAEGGKES